MKYFIILLIFGLFFIQSCSDNTEPSLYPCPVYQDDLEDFTGITETNEDGFCIGNVDSNDWYYNDNKRGAGDNVIPAGYYFGPAYPNPMSTNSITMFYTMSEADRVTLIIINDAEELIRTLIYGVQEYGTHSVAWDKLDNNSEIVESGIYRAIIHMNNSEFHCYGDILVE